MCTWIALDCRPTGMQIANLSPIVTGRPTAWEGRITRSVAKGQVHRPSLATESTAPHGMTLK